MIKAIYLQIGAAVVTVLVLSLIVGKEGAISASMGGGACILPNALFALRLGLLSKHAEASSLAVNFFVGEFIKVAATIGLLVIAIKTYPAMHWPSLLIGMAVALQASFFAFWKKS